MAKRKRLTPARAGFLETPAQTSRESKAFTSGPAPIAQVAGESSATAALSELAAEMRAARESGRLVQALPLNAVETDYLVRDRLHVGEAEMEDLLASIRERGQQTPIEVVALENGRFGLISGWRRLTAIRRLHEETQASAFATVQALLRRPESAADAYRAMVEENEIRVGLSYYERARIAAKAVEAGVHRNARDAVAELFATASRAKRSKIASFLAVHDALDDRLRFPAAIPERLGLALARALESDPSLREKLRERLRKTAPETAEGEVALLTRALNGEAKSGRKKSPIHGLESSGGAAEAPSLQSVVAVDEPVPGVKLEIGGKHPKPVLTLSGPKVDQDFRERLVAWLKSGG